MRKLNFLIVCFSILGYPLFSVAQHWKDIGGLDRPPRCMFEDTAENSLYIGGDFFVAGNDTVGGIAKWDGHQFHSLGCGVNWGCNPSTTYSNYGGYVQAIAKYNNDIYVTGDIRKAGNVPVNYIARWNGSCWDSVGHGLQWPGLTLAVIDNELYVGGAFDSAGGIQVNSLAKWNGSQWSDVHNFPVLWDPPSTNYVYAIAKYNGELYVGGNFNNDSINDIVKFNGSSWQSINSGLYGSLAYIDDMAVYEDELYVAGAFYKVDGNAGNFIQRWDGTYWKDVGGGTTYNFSNPNANGQIFDMKIHDNELYIAGVFKYAGGVPAPNVAKWDGTKWCGFGGNFDVANSVGFCKDTLYVGGVFYTIDGDSMKYIAKWIGGSYIDTCSNTTSVDEIDKEENIITIYPNPFHTSAILQLQNQLKNGTLLIYDIIGKKVKQLENLSGKQITIAREGLKSGMYFYTLSDGKEKIGQGKMVVE